MLRDGLSCSMFQFRMGEWIMMMMDDSAWSGLPGCWMDDGGRMMTKALQPCHTEPARPARGPLFATSGQPYAPIPNIAFGLARQQDNSLTPTPAPATLFGGSCYCSSSSSSSPLLIPHTGSSIHTRLVSSHRVVPMQPRSFELTNHGANNGVVIAAECSFISEAQTCLRWGQ